APRYRRHRMGGGRQAVPAERAERRRGPHAGDAGVRDVLIQNPNPVIVKIVTPPTDESGLSQLAGVLIGSLGLTGAIVLIALLLGALMAGIMFLWRRRSA